MHATSKPAELVAARESTPDPYCGTPLGVEAAWCPRGIDVPSVLGTTETAAKGQISVSPDTTALAEQLLTVQA